MEKIGIVDLGSNSARLVVVSLFAEGYFMVVDELKESVRLGHDMDRDGFLKPQRIAETIRTLKTFKRLCDAHKVSRIIAVGTAAVRRAKNQRSFLDEIQATCGMKIYVLSPEEEATYIYRGVINSMDIPRGLILEIGGGSTKIVHYNRRNILNYEVLPFGAVTLTDLFYEEDKKPEDLVEQVREFFTEQLQQIPWLKEVDPDAQMIGVGGSFRNLFKINKMVRRYPLDTVHNFNFSVEDFCSIYDMIRVLPVEKCKRIRGLSPERADIMPAALAVIKAFVDYTGKTNFTISGSGLREGMMFNQAVPQTVEKPISDPLTYSLNTLIKYYECNEAHVEHVVNLSMQLFKQLRVLHKYPRPYQKILKIAASLHDCGTRVKYYKHEKHSGYMILNATIYGATHREIVLAAFVASAQRREDVNQAEWAKYRDIVQEDDIEAVRKLSMLLRIAKSLDRSMAGIVTGINCDLLGDSVIMKTEVTADATLEICDAMKSGQDFQRVFKKKLEIL